MNLNTPEALLAELTECHNLLHAVAARLLAVNAAMLSSAAGPSDSSFPKHELLEKVSHPHFPHPNVAGERAEPQFPQTDAHREREAIIFPEASAVGEISEKDIPQTRVLGERTAKAFPQRDLIREKAASELPSLTRLCIILKLHAFPEGTHASRIRYAARVMLSLKTNPGMYGLSHFAKLLGMTYSGAGKAMMVFRNVGIIHRTAYKVHELTPKGEALLLEAVNYVPPIE